MKIRNNNNNKFLCTGLDTELGRNSHVYARQEYDNQILIAEKKAEDGTREARIRQRQEQKAEAGSSLYGDVIDDSS